MKKFAKLLALLLAVLFVFSACQTTPGNENGTGDGNDSDQTTEKTKATTSDPGQNTPLAEGEGTVLNADSDYLYYFSRYFNNDLSNLSAKIPQYFNEHWKDTFISTGADVVGLWLYYQDIAKKVTGKPIRKVGK